MIPIPFVYLRLAGYGAALLVASATGWHFGAGRVQNQWDKDRAELAEVSAEQQRQRASADTRRQENATNALDAYAQTARLRAADNAAVRDELARVRDALAARTAAAASAPDAAGSADAAARAVAGECAGAVASLGEHADDLRSRLAGLQQWVGAACSEGAK